MSGAAAQAAVYRVEARNLAAAALAAGKDSAVFQRWRRLHARAEAVESGDRNALAALDAMGALEAGKKPAAPVKSVEAVKKPPAPGKDLAGGAVLPDAQIYQLIGQGVGLFCELMRRSKRGSIAVNEALGRLILAKKIVRLPGKPTANSLAGRYVRADDPAAAAFRTTDEVLTDAVSNGVVSVSRLASRAGVTVKTVRKRLKLLIAAGKIRQDMPGGAS